MMSIGLIDSLLNSTSMSANKRSTVIYFFCQNADRQLNTAPSLMKGLIRRLFEEHYESRPALRALWDDNRRCPHERTIPLSELWLILQDMLRKCTSECIYVVVDALDECQADGLQEFLRLLASEGLGLSKIKWLLTSRPRHEAEHIVFPGDHDRVQLSLDLESHKLAEAVATYVTKRLDVLASRRGYDAVLRQHIREQLVRKAEGTFLWVSLVCQRLEKTPAESALAALDDLPPGLHSLYARTFWELGQGDAHSYRPRMHLLKAMLLSFRPLRVDELQTVMHEDDEDATMINIDLCASFIRKREDGPGSVAIVEFQHQSARDYLAGIGISVDAASATFVRYGDADIAANALSALNRCLRVNILDVPRPQSDEEVEAAFTKAETSDSLSQLRYAALFWAQHFCSACSSVPVYAVPPHSVMVIDFLTNRVMEWFECLGWLGDLAAVVSALRLIESLTGTLQVSLADQSTYAILTAEIVRRRLVHRIACEGCFEISAAALP
jgi:hypothetical protein